MNNSLFDDEAETGKASSSRKEEESGSQQQQQQEEESPPLHHQHHSNNNDNNNDDLLQKLQYLRRKRRQIQKTRSDVRRQQLAVTNQLTKLQLERQESIEQFQSLLEQRQHTSKFLNVSQQWNVINDCFHIWYQGPFASILNARLGLSAPNFQQPISDYGYGSTPSSSSSSSPTTQSSSPAVPPPQRRSYFLWPSLAATAPINDSTTPSMTSSSSASSSVTTNNLSSNSSIGVSANSNNSTANERIVVPWPEINAALGYVVLLLKILQEKVGFTFTHTLLPQGSTSKIVIDNRSVYNLFFDDTSSTMIMMMGGRGYNMRNFHLALQALLQIVAEAAVQLVDKTIVLPHVITRGGGIKDTISTTTPTTAGGEWKIGGLSINPDEQIQSSQQQSTTTTSSQPSSTSSSSSSSNFTRACKYLLTDIKWLVAYTVKHHVDR